MPIDTKQTPTTKSSSSSSSSSSMSNSGPANGTINSSSGTTPKSVDWFKKKTETAFKKVNRLEEKFNQAIGKATRTEDDQFESYLIKFEQQYLASNLIQKELQKYIQSIKEAQKCSKNFYETLKQVYEPTWPSYNDIIQQCQLQEKYWNDLYLGLNSNINVQINEYNKQFPEYKKLIEKRQNKLLDFDKARHTLDDMQSKTNYDDVKVNKARLDLREKQRLYDDLNIDLHKRLPSLHVSRVDVYGSVFKQFFEFEKDFHESMVQSKVNFEQIFDKLYETRSDEQMQQSQTNASENNVTVNIDDDADDDGDDGCERAKSGENGNSRSTSSVFSPATDDLPNLVDECVITKPLYKVKATYPYDSKETDELTFAKDDIIEVVESTEAEREDLDDGWLIGIHEKTKKRGLFPENFTKRVVQ